MIKGRFLVCGTWILTTVMIFTDAGRSNLPSFLFKKAQKYYALCGLNNMLDKFYTILCRSVHKSATEHRFSALYRNGKRVKNLGERNIYFVQGCTHECPAEHRQKFPALYVMISLRTLTLVEEKNVIVSLSNIFCKSTRNGYFFNEKALKFPGSLSGNGEKAQWLGPGNASELHVMHYCWYPRPRQYTTVR